MISLENDPLDFEEYGYPSVDILSKCVRICLGWFMPIDAAEDPAFYLDIFIDRKGQAREFIDIPGCSFDIKTPLKDYGHYNDFGQWIPVNLEELAAAEEESDEQDF
jgi:hypothetical protein